MMCDISLSAEARTTTHTSPEALKYISYIVLQDPRVISKLLTV